MTPLMYERVRNLIVGAGLTGNAKVQLRYWRDTGKQTDSFVVFRPAGGSPLRNDLGSEYMVRVDIIGVVDRDVEAEEIANSILSYVQDNPMPNDCIGHIENVGGFPQPMLSSERRIVYSLQFACLFAE